MIGSAVKSASGASQPQVFTALCKLARVLPEGGYSFVTPTPLTIERVNTRPENATATSTENKTRFATLGSGTVVETPSFSATRP